jgi:hypothetical protein
MRKGMSWVSRDMIPDLAPTARPGIPAASIVSFGICFCVLLSFFMAGSPLHLSECVSQLIAV